LKQVSIFYPCRSIDFEVVVGFCMGCELGGQERAGVSFVLMQYLSTEQAPTILGDTQHCSSCIIQRVIRQNSCLPHRGRSLHELLPQGDALSFGLKWLVEGTTIHCWRGDFS
jgi:hypothetical protein